MSEKLGGSLKGWVLFAENSQKHAFLLLMESEEVEDKGSSALTPIPEPQELRGWTITKDLVELLFVRFKEGTDSLAEDAPSSGPLLEILRFLGDGLLLRQDGKKQHRKPE